MRCSLAPVCLPEEARLATRTGWEPIRLFPPDDERRVVHVLESGTRVGKAGEQLKITYRDKRVETMPIRQVSQVVLHGFAQISTQALRFCGFNALLSFGYALVLKDVMNAILAVGLEPALGFYHQPRSTAPPLALDLLEIFRVLLVDMPVLSSINRQQWEVKPDFTIAGEQVWLSDTGREKLITLYERRKTETWKHPAIGYSLSYARMIELEVRLLEKEWMQEGGLFAKIRLR